MTDKSSTSPIMIFLIAALLLVSPASSFFSPTFVRQTSATDFEVDLDEQGARITQAVSVDPTNGLVVTRVPAHRYLSAATFVFDSRNGLMLDVVEQSMTCTVHRPFVSLDSWTQLDVLQSQSADNQAGMKPLKIDNTTATPIFLTTVLGPRLDRADLPVELARFCPGDYTVFSARQVRREDDAEAAREFESGSGRVLLDDPLTRRDVQYGDEVPEFEELFDALPEAAARSRRRKRAVCKKFENGKLVRTINNCHFEQVTCPDGCSNKDVRWNCQNTTYHCQYVLLCPIAFGSDQCIAHIQSGTNTCTPCCKNANCGRGMPKCNF